MLVDVFNTKPQTYNKILEVTQFLDDPQNFDWNSVFYHLKFDQQTQETALKDY